VTEPFFWGLLAFLLGLIVGSFLNVVVYRVPRGLSVVRPRSRCPWCGGEIAAFDNVPVLGYLLLRGRCRRCGGPIGWRYPAVEAGMGFLFLLIYLRFGERPPAIAAALFSALVVALGLIDFDHLLLPDSITLPGIAVGWLLSVPSAFREPIALIGPEPSGLGLLCGAGGLFLFAEAWLWLRNEEGLGLGDAKMFGLVGAFLGWRGCVTTMAVACVAGTLVAVLLLLRGRAHRRTRLPFGVFLAFGGLVALFVGPAFLGRFVQLP